MLSDRRKRGAAREGECVYMCVREINSQRQAETVKNSQRQRVIPSPQGSYH